MNILKTVSCIFHEDDFTVCELSQFFLSYQWVFKNKCTYRNTPSAKVIIFLLVKNKNVHPKNRKGLGYFSDPQYLTLCWNF